MKTYTITKENFLNWYYNTGSDDEQESMVNDLGAMAIEHLFRNGKFEFSVYSAFEEAEKDIIPLCFLEEFDDSDEREVGDLQEECEIKLLE